MPKTIYHITNKIVWATKFQRHVHPLSLKQSPNFKYIHIVHYKKPGDSQLPMYSTVQLLNHLSSWPRYAMINNNNGCITSSLTLQMSNTCYVSLTPLPRKKSFHLYFNSSNHSFLILNVMHWSTIFKQSTEAKLINNSLFFL